MDVCAPKDGFVIKLFVQDKQQVTKGAPLLQMDTDLEDRITDRVETMEAAREIKAAQYTGPQLELLRAIAQLAVDLSKEKAKNAKFALDIAVQKFNLGILSTEQLEPIQSDYAQSQLEQTRAQAQQKQLEFSVTRHNQTDALAKKLSEDHKIFISKRRDRLKLIAPKDGQVKLLVADNSFAELGSILLEIA